MIEKCKIIFKTKKYENKFITITSAGYERPLLEVIWN